MTTHQQHPAGAVPPAAGSPDRVSPSPSGDLAVPAPARPPDEVAGGAARARLGARSTRDDDGDGGGLAEERSGVDTERVQRAVRELLLAVGEDPDREGLRDTPARVARSYAELFSGLHIDPAEVLGSVFDEGHDELVLVRDIAVYSFCEHHLLPWYGAAHVGYLPDAHGRITGISKLARLVDLYAKRPQVQERLTGQVADTLMSVLAPRGVIVVVEAEHLCMSMRGIRKPGARTVTSAVRGALRDSPVTRAEAMSLILGR